jgi:hypothetical protein
MGSARRVLTDVLIALGLRNIHFCKGDPSGLYKIEFATRSDERCRSSGYMRIVFFYLHLQQRKTDRTHIHLTDVLLGIVLGHLHFCNGDPSHLYKIESTTDSDGLCEISGCWRLVFYVRLNINEDVT